MHRDKEGNHSSLFKILTRETCKRLQRKCPIDRGGRICGFRNRFVTTELSLPENKPFATGDISEGFQVTTGALVHLNCIKGKLTVMDDILASIFIIFLLLLYSSIALVFVVMGIRTWIWRPLRKKSPEKEHTRKFRHVKSTRSQHSPS